MCCGTVHYWWDNRGSHSIRACAAQRALNPTPWGALRVADDPKSLGPLRGTALGAAHAEFMEGVGRYFEAGSGLQGSGVQV